MTTAQMKHQRTVAQVVTGGSSGGEKREPDTAHSSGEDHSLREWTTLLLLFNHHVVIIVIRAAPDRRQRPVFRVSPLARLRLRRQDTAPCGPHGGPLSRPRRFGKSVLVSTLEAAFMPNGPEKDQLFEGLWVQRNAPHLLKHELPLLSFDLSALAISQGPGALKESLRIQLHTIANRLGVPLPDTALVPPLVSEPITKAAAKAPSKRVVVLIDEVSPFPFSLWRCPTLPSPLHTSTTPRWYASLMRRAASTKVQWPTRESSPRALCDDQEPPQLHPPPVRHGRVQVWAHGALFSAN
jgi:hypothetical protein